MLVFLNTASAQYGIPMNYSGIKANAYFSFHYGGNIGLAYYRQSFENQLYIGGKYNVTAKVSNDHYRFPGVFQDNFGLFAGYRHTFKRAEHVKYFTDYRITYTHVLGSGDVIYKSLDPRPESVDNLYEMTVGFGIKDNFKWRIYAFHSWHAGLVYRTTRITDTKGIAQLREGQTGSKISPTIMLEVGIGYKFY